MRSTHPTLRRAALFAAPAVLTVGLVGMSMPAAHAAPAKNGTPGCATKAEYKKVKKGNKKSAVKTKLGTGGKRMSRVSAAGHVAEIREYKTCAKYSSIVISFMDGKVDAKSAVWLS